MFYIDKKQHKQVSTLHLPPVHPPWDPWVRRGNGLFALVSSFPKAALLSSY